MTIWNKIIQQLVMGDDSSVKLAFHLCSDKLSLFHWTWLYDFEAKGLGVPHVSTIIRRNFVRAVGTPFVNHTVLMSSYNSWDSETYLKKIKLKL